MQDKHKVTLYLTPELHRQLKIRSAVELEPMSAIAERAIIFYLTHSDVVDEVEMSHGQTHRIYNCPECATSLVVREGDLTVLDSHSDVLVDSEEEPAMAGAQGDRIGSEFDRNELVPC